MKLPSCKYEELPDIAKRTDAPDDLLLDSAQAGALLGNISHNWMRNARHQGRGPSYVLIGNNVRYRLGDLRAYVASMTVKIDTGPVVCVDHLGRPTPEGSYIRRIRHKGERAATRALRIKAAVDEHVRRLAEIAATQNLGGSGANGARAKTTAETVTS